MRLSELARLAGRRGATSYLQKHGYVMPAIAVGLQLPGALSRAAERRDSATKGMNAATGEPLDASVAEKRGNSTSYSGSSYSGSYAPPTPPTTPGFSMGGVLSGISGLKPSAMKPGQTMSNPSLGQHAAQIVGTMVAQAGGSLLKDLASKAWSAFGARGDEAARTAILQSLRHEDPILAEANETVLMDAYHSMVRWAPMLATDKNAVRSWLRQAVMSGAGPDYASIKMLADSERAVTGGGKIV